MSDLTVTPDELRAAAAVVAGLGDDLPGLALAPAASALPGSATAGALDTTRSADTQAREIGMPAVIATPFVKPLFLDVPNNPADLAHDDSWTRALAPLEPLAQPDSTITNYYLIDGYAQTHPEIRAGFTDRHGVSFFNADGHLDWDRVNADTGQFDQAKNRIFDPALAGFRADFQAGLTDSTIRDTGHPGPRPPR